MNSFRKKIPMAIAILFIGISVSAMAEQRNPNKNNDKNTYRQGVDVPISTNPNKSVVRDRLELSTGENAGKYKNAQYKRMERDRVLNEIFDPLILMTPIVRVIRPIDSIGISPAYITQIVFPADIVITDMITSFDVKVLESNRNILRIRPDARTFFAGNLVLTLSDGRKNYTMNIFAERYYKDECKEDSEENNYICRRKREAGLSNDSKYTYAYNNLSTLYRYINPTPVDDMEVIALYERLNGESLYIAENGGQVTVNYQGISYTITRDDKFGSFEGGIMYRGVGYRVMTSVDSQGS